MRINKIELLNYRQHRKCEFCFDRKTGEKDLHIFVADNTVGKTNILNAISWCLYAKEPHLQNESAAICRLNSAEQEKIKAQGGGTGDLMVKIYFRLDDDRILIFQRTETYNIGAGFCRSVDTSFTALLQEENGSNMDSIINKDDVEALVRAYIPYEVREFIFFDAERLKSFFGKQMQENVKTGIYNYTQANIIDESIRVFKNFVSDELDPIINSSGDRDITDLNRRVNEAKTHVNEQQKKIEDIKEQIAVCESEIRRLDSVISGFDNVGEKDAERARIQRDIDDYEHEKDSILDERMKEVRSLYIDAKFFPYIKSYYEFILSEEKNAAGNVVKIDKQELGRILKAGECTVCGQRLTEQAYAYVQSLMNDTASSIKLSGELTSDKGKIMEYFQGIEEKKAKVRKLADRADSIDTKITGLDTERQKIVEYLSHVPDTSAVKQSIEDRDEFYRKKDDYNQRLGVENQKLKELQDKYTAVSNEFTRAMSRHASLVEYNRQKNMCVECCDILEETRDEVLQECREAMEKKTYSLFANIFSKKGKYQRVEILRDYTVKLFDIYGNQTLGSCSAGETNILAYCFTLALQEVSGRDSLLFIDTPLGRIDPENRANLLDDLVKNADEKQIILLFTPAEYDDMAKSIIGGRYSTYEELTVTNLSNR